MEENIVKTETINKLYLLRLLLSSFKDTLYSEKEIAKFENEVTNLKNLFLY